MGSKNLEEKAVTIEINGESKKIVQIKGIVMLVTGISKPIKIRNPSIGSITDSLDFQTTGYQKELDIFLNNRDQRDNIINLKFKGESPIERGNLIKVGVILSKDANYGREEVLYIGIFDATGNKGRIDFKEGYTPSKEDIKKLGLTY